MKLVLVKQKHVPFGGGEGYLARLLTAAADRGHEVHLVTSSWPDDPGYRPFKVHPVSVSRHSRAARSLSFSRGVVEATKTLQPDLVFTLDRTEGADVWRAGEGVHRVWLKRREEFEPAWKVRLNARSHGQQALVCLETACADEARLIIANSNLVAADVKTTYPELKARVEVIHNGIDLQRFSLAQREENRAIRRSRVCRPELLFVGSGFHRKGLRETLMALQRLPEVKLRVVGRDASGPWRRLAGKFGVGDRVSFTPPQSDLTALYQAADILVFPSWFESFGFVGLEAMACGTPVVTSRYAGVHELVQEEVGGRVIDSPGNIEQLTASVQSLLDHPVSPEAISASVGHASLETNLTRTLDALDNTL